MNFFSALAFMLIYFNINLANSQNISTLSIAIYETIDKFYSKYSKNVDIIDFRGLQGDLVKKIVENSNSSLTLTIKNVKHPQKWTKKLENQSILLFNHIIDLAMFNNKELIQMKFLNPIRFLVYCQNATAPMVSMLRTNLIIPPYYYFIIFDKFDKKFKLFTFENRKDLKFCHESQRLVQINQFSETTQKWIKNPIFGKKYKNFYNCIMSLGIEGSANFVRLSQQTESNQADKGPIILILSEIADELNFTILANVCYEKNCLQSMRNRKYLYNSLSKESLDGYAVNRDQNSQWKNVLLNIECVPKLYIPPGDLYTSFEKIILPFDRETWIGIVATLVSAVAATYIIVRFSKNLKTLLFGSNVQNPIFDIVRGFFGIGQTILPDGHFARLIFLLFIFWCLVIRTAYQGKLFEFTTTAIRKPEMRTLEELRDRNFTLYVPENNEYHKILDFVKKVIGLKTKAISSYEYTRTYMEYISDPGFKGTLLTCDIEHQMFIYFSKVPLPKRFIPTPITRSIYAIGFIHPNLWNERLQEIIEAFITGGIINLHLERFTKSKWNLEKNDYESEKVVLNLSHLGFGFQICFFLFYVAFLIFLVELIMSLRNKKVEDHQN